MNSRKQELYEAYKSRLPLDPMALDDALMRLPFETMEVAEQATIAWQTQQRWELDLDVVEAEVDAEIRAGFDPEDRKAKKTEKQIAAEVLLSDRYRQVRARYEEARVETAMWQALVNAMKIKANSLQAYNQLVLAGYVTPDAVYKTRRREITEQRVARSSRSREME